MRSNHTIKITSLILFYIAIAVALFFVLRTPAHSEWVLMNGVGPKCMDVEGGRVVEGARIIGYDCHAGINQRFDITMDGGNIKVGGLCLDASNASFDNGAELILWKCHGGTNQNWVYDKAKNRLLNYYEKCVDLEGGSQFWGNRQRAILWECNSHPNQKWYFSQAVLASRVKGGLIVDPKTQIEIRASKVISAGLNGVLYNQNNKPVLPSNNTTILVDSKTTLVSTQNQRVIVPVQTLH